MDSKQIEQILENADKINQLHEQVQKSHKNKAHNSEEWQNATDAFHTRYDQLAFPGGLKHGLELLKNNDPGAIESAIAYLKADPYFHRSGYIKQTVCRLLKQARLTKSQIQELQKILLASLQTPLRREFIEYCRLARKIANPDFITHLNRIAAEAPSSMQRKAEIMLFRINT